MADQLPQERVEELQKAFSMLDKDHNGKVDAEELGVLMATLGQDVTLGQLQGMIKEFDEDANGTFEFSEFLRMFTYKPKGGFSEEEMVATFKVFDMDGDDFITASDLRKIMASLDHTVTDDQIMEMIQEADFDGDGRLSYQDFLTVMINREEESS